MAALMTTKSRGNVLLGLGLLLLSQGVLGFGGAPTVARRSAMSASALRMVSLLPAGAAAHAQAGRPETQLVTLAATATPAPRACAGDR